MGIIWKCQPVTWCTCINLHSSIYESNQQKILDVLFSYDLHVLCDFYSNCFKCHYECKSVYGRNCSIPCEWTAADCSSILNCTCSHCGSTLCKDFDVYW